MGRKGTAARTLSDPEAQLLKLLAEGPRRLKDLQQAADAPVSGALLQAMTQRGWIEKSRQIKGGRTRAKTERYVRCLDMQRTTEGLSPARRKLVHLLRGATEMAVHHLKAQIPSAPRLIKSLEAEGFLKIVQRTVYRDPFGDPVAGLFPR